MDNRRIGARGVPLLALALIVGAVTLIGLPIASSDDEAPAAPVAAAPVAPAAATHVFETPEALVEAMIAGAAGNDDAALKAIAGPESGDLVQPGGDPTVARTRAEFAANAAEFWKLEDNEDGSKTLVMGDHRWPFPVPLVKTDAGWVLDIESGREEILCRRIGKNELAAIKLLRAIGEVQEEYASVDRDGDRVKEYAQLIRSTPGNMDGLYWSTEEHGEMSPLGPLVEPAREYLEQRQTGDPVGGYVWRILLGQGKCAPGSCHHYVINGNMVAGYAIMASPARYGETGVMTFLVSKTGDVYQKDHGLNTPYYAKMTQWFDPDGTWQIVKD